MTELFLDIWTFSFSQLGLVAIGILLAEWLGLRVRRVTKSDDGSQAS